jgi:hypothetical protein
MFPEDHVLNDDAETALEETVRRCPSELILQAELGLGLRWSTRNHLHLAGDDHPKIIAPNMHAATEPLRDYIGNRRFPRSRDTRDPVDAPARFTHAVHPRDRRPTTPPAASSSSTRGRMTVPSPATRRARMDIVPGALG